MSWIVTPEQYVELDAARDRNRWPKKMSRVWSEKSYFSKRGCILNYLAGRAGWTQEINDVRRASPSEAQGIKRLEEFYGLPEGVVSSLLDRNCDDDLSKRERSRVTKKIYELFADNVLVINSNYSAELVIEPKEEDKERVAVLS